VEGIVLVATLFALFGCAPGNGDDGTGPRPDARLISNIHTLGCRDGTYRFLGVESEEISFEVAPDALEPRSLPEPGTCEAGLDLFPMDAGPGGGNPEDVSAEVIWTAAQSSGTLKRRSTGFWASWDAGTQLTCIGATDIGAVELLDAGDYSGIDTPWPPSDGNVTPTAEASDGIEFGETFELPFEAPNWDEVWVQLRRVRNVEAWETLTCNVTGDTSFTLGAEHWSEMTESLSVDENQLLVVFESARTDTLDDGQAMETVTRSITSAADL
jgi:hypothetical protein